jgi:uroporphyrinogen-III synthase
VQILLCYVRAVREMRVLVTRPLEDSRRTAKALAERGHEAVIAPLFEIEYRDGAELPLEGVQAVLATSSNGVRGLARSTARREIPLFAVGAHTAATAKGEGFRSVENADGDAGALAALVRARLRPEAGALLHATGANASQEFSAALEAAGFEVRTCLLYDIMEAGELPTSAAEALRSGSLDAVLIYSPKSARLFVDRMKRAGLAFSCSRLLACCISKEAADLMEGISFAAIRVAAHSNQASLLELLA